MTIFSRAERWWIFILLVAMSVVASVGGAIHDQGYAGVAALAFFVMLWVLDARVVKVREDLERGHLDIDSRLPRTDLQWAITVMMMAALMIAVAIPMWNSPSTIMNAALPAVVWPVIIYAIRWLNAFERAAFDMMAMTSTSTLDVGFPRHMGNG